MTNLKICTVNAMREEKKELLEAVARSSRSFEEIIAFVQSDSDENE